MQPILLVASVTELVIEADGFGAVFQGLAVVAQVFAYHCFYEVVLSEEGQVGGSEHSAGDVQQQLVGLLIPIEVR